MNLNWYICTNFELTLAARILIHSVQSAGACGDGLRPGEKKGGSRRVCSVETSAGVPGRNTNKNGQRFYRETSWWDEAEQTVFTEKAFIVGKFEDVLPANDPDYQRIQKTRIDDNVLHIAVTDLTGVTVGTLEYLHRDYLGSVEKVTDEAGNVILDTAFDAFGKRRGADWQSEIQAQELEDLLGTQGLTTRRGFTGHEHLDRTGLIHMNGRIYDPQLGRFLSPDPFVASPANSQSWNRYSYVLNNPMQFTDPSGYTPLQKFHDGGGSSDGWDVNVVGSPISTPSGWGTTSFDNVKSGYGSPGSSGRLGYDNVGGSGPSKGGENKNKNEESNSASVGSAYESEVVTIGYREPSYSDFLQDEWLNILFRSGQTIGGAGQVLLGGTICYASGGLACALGILIAAKGVDNIQAGIRGEDSASEQLLVSATGSEQAGALINAGLDVGNVCGRIV